MSEEVKDIGTVVVGCDFVDSPSISNHLMFYHSRADGLIIIDNQILDNNITKEEVERFYNVIKERISPTLEEVVTPLLLESDTPKVLPYLYKEKKMVNHV